MVCLSFCLSQYWAVQKTAELIEMPFGLRTSVGPRNHVLDGVQIPHGKGQFWWGKGRPVVKCMDALSWAEQKWLNRSRCHLGYGLGWVQGTIIRWSSDTPMRRGNFYGEKGRPIVKYSDSLSWDVQKRLNRSRCCLGCGLGWVQGSMY